jgi:hypothetical protein
MTKPIAIVADSYGHEHHVTITRSRASITRTRPGWDKAVTFYAPAWRPMIMQDYAAAQCKIERHPNFIRWDA